MRGSRDDLHITGEGLVQMQALLSTFQMQWLGSGSGRPLLPVFVEQAPRALRLPRRSPRTEGLARGAGPGAANLSRACGA